MWSNEKVGDDVPLKEGGDVWWCCYVAFLIGSGSYVQEFLKSFRQH